MQKPKLVDNATENLEFQDSSTELALDGTILRAAFQNDNFSNLFKLVNAAGYSLIDDDMSQITKAVRGKYVADFIYNTSSIATQTVSDVVLGSDGYYYECLENGTSGVDPVGDLTGKWEIFDNNSVLKKGDQTLAGIKTFSANPISSAAQSSSVNALTRRDFVTTLDAQNIKLSGDQTLAGIKTFSSFPVTPSSAPTTNYQTANKKYVDDNLSKQTFEKPSNSVLFIKLSPSSIKIPTGLRLTVNSVIFTLASDYMLSLNTDLVGSSKTAGTDYYVYAKSDMTFYLSASDAITADKLIGGFHYGPVPEAFTAINKLSTTDAESIRGIWEDSIWDLKWKPTASPKGMTYNKFGFWNDIYLCNSEHIANGTSKLGATIAGGATTNSRAFPKIPLIFGGNGTLNYGKFDWHNAHEIASSHGKRLMTFGELSVLAYGVKEASSAGGLDNGTIQYLADYTSRYMIQATGNQWVWSRDNWGGNAAIFGGRSDNAAASSSQYGSWGSAVSYSAWGYGSRFACDHLVLA